MGKDAVDHTSSAAPPAGEEKCPLSDEQREQWLRMHSREQPTESDPAPLSEDRQLSSIPRTDTGKNWVYPSEKQFRDSLLRKGKNAVPLPATGGSSGGGGAPPGADDAVYRSIIPIHNSVNERVWRCIREWESPGGGLRGGGAAGPGSGDITLTSFKGDFRKWTPRAWIRHYVFRMSRPFDRHDWLVHRTQSGRSLEYVIDFYYADSGRSNVPEVVLDVRPKLNSWEGVKLRVKHWFK
ncbi:cytochrome c1 heme lyase CYT2 KNAG_0H00300 [Huiozyma naganishii CBS 8797]|uniref:Holocytochrome c-type synthase n=1 Tax=Huiozyma naganishii (strain ATCC MYA-139 / BCRC 22969 / CBS 8797 / KCTC 17520 / NBRC 10181 / NCYC 3082 / Yp74L-3) TaxID=1071383 RepID=J7S9C9_HUIN7|nr:hypothetical protein KNAG_0H00300 [Kazachstania naganishii CBS 8797]CCK71446.1 hypothetical protein KNAG_0H00300 [Kazachstania naganishii CBS 8797]